MIGEALMGLEFSPNPSVARILASDNEDTNSTQPGAGDIYPPPTPGSDLLFSGALETPRYFHSAPSLLSSPVEPSSSVPGTDPTAMHSNDFSQTFPPAPLTPYSELPTPGRWPSSPTPPKLTPGMFLQTPESFKRNYLAPLDEASRLPEISGQQLMPSHEFSRSQVEEVNALASSSLNPSATPQEDIDRVCIYRGKVPKILGGETGSGKCQTIDGADTDNLPELQVRRRLFDQGDEDKRCKSEAKDRSSKPEEHPNSGNAKSLGYTLSGLRSRLPPPPPIAVPGPSNTTPGGIYPVSKHPIRKDEVAVEDRIAPKIVLPSLDAKKLSEMLKKRRDDHRQPEKVKISDTEAEQQRKKKKSRAKHQIEEKRPMSERASLVLAEMRRQMSQAQESGEVGGSSNSVPDGTDATNFLQYTSAVQAPLNASKETERPVCNCKASQCIKRYCPCFATSNFCGKGCGCRNCENTTEYSSVVGRARRVLLERDPNAFVPRIRNTQRSSARGRQTIRGCNCRKGCEKNYCICKENGLICGVRCTCSGPNGCQNYDESKLEKVRQVIENAQATGSGSAPLLDAKKLKIREVEGIRPNVKHAKHERSVEREKVTPLRKNQENIPEIPASPVFGPFDVLPTPTTPSLPYNPFSEGDPASRKRVITFGNPSDSFKKIKIGDHSGSALPELRQSSSRYSGHHYKTPPMKMSAPPDRFVGTPLTTRLLSEDTPPGNSSDEQWKRRSKEANMNHADDGNSASIPSEDKRMAHIPRIFRYKFGSGKAVNSFAFKS